MGLEVRTERVCGTERVCRAKAKELINGIAAYKDFGTERVCGTECVCRAKADKLRI